MTCKERSPRHYFDTPRLAGQKKPPATPRSASTQTTNLYIFHYRRKNAERQNLSAFSVIDIIFV